MNKLLIFTLMSIFLFSFTSALDFDNIVKLDKVTSGETYIIGNKEIEHIELWDKYPPVKIDNAYGLPLIGDTLYKDVLMEHSETCGYQDNCLDIWEAELSVEAPLVDNIIYKIVLEDGTLIDGKVRWDKLFYWGNIIDYETQCSDGETIVSENGTTFTPQTCEQVEVGSHEGWIEFSKGQIFPAGNYKVKLLAEKRPDWTIDYIPVIMGKEITSRAVWGSSPQLIASSNTEVSYSVMDSYTSVKNITINNYVVYGTSETKLSGAGASPSRIRYAFVYTNGTTINVDNESITWTTYTEMKFNNPLLGNNVSKIEIFLARGGGGGTVYENNTRIYGNQTGNVYLNSPTSGSTQSTTLVTTNASFVITGGAYGVNGTLWTNETGSWGARNTTAFYNGNNTFGSSLDTAFWTYNREPAYVTVSNGVLTLVDTSSGTAPDGQLSSISMNNNEYDVSTLLKVTASGNGAGEYVGSFGVVTTQTDTVGNAGVWIARKSGDTNFKAFNGTAEVDTGVAFVLNTNYTMRIRKIGTNVTYFINNNQVASITDGSSTNNRYISMYAGKNSITTVSTSYFWTSFQLYYTNYTTTFTNTYPSGSNILWNYQFCDSDGACGFATSNYTFSVDSVAPTIALNYPTALINYGAVNGSLQLNFTVTDSNLASVWYDYNGTNVTIAGATSGVANLSNITLSTKKNVTIYANDTAGNVESETFSWDYYVFANQIIYNPNTTTTSSETFTLVTQKDASIATITAYLWYNGVPYLSTVTTSGNNVNISNTFEIPSGPATRPFFWAITTVGTAGTINMNTSSLTQTVSNLSLAYCTAPSTTGLTLNFTTYDTATDLPINSSFEATFSYYASGGSGSVLETYNYQNLTQNRSNYLFCLNSSGINVTLDAFIEYYKTGYDPRSYIINDGIIGNFTQTIPLYLTATSLTDIVTIVIQDQNYNPLPGALVTIQEWNVGTNTYSTIGMFTTSSEGTGIMDLELYSKWYRAIITYEGVIVKVTDVQKLSSTSWSILVELGVDNPYDVFGSISHGLVFSNSTNITTFSWVDSSGYVNTACMFVQNSTSLGYITIYSDCVDSVAGSINYQLTQNGTYQVYGIIYLTADYDNVSQITDTLYIQLGEPELYQKTGRFGKVITLLFVGTSALIGVSMGSPIMGLILLVGSLFGAAKMGWINGMELIIWGLISVALVLIARQSRRGG